MAGDCKCRCIRKEFGCKWQVSIFLEYENSFYILYKTPSLRPSVRPFAIFFLAIKIYKNANKIKMQFFHFIKYDLKGRRSNKVTFLFTKQLFMKTNIKRAQFFYRIKNDLKGHWRSYKIFFILFIIYEPILIERCISANIMKT